MVQLDLLVAALDQVSRAEATIVTAMAESGIRSPMVIIHPMRDGQRVPTVTLYSVDAVFEVGRRRPRYSRKVDVLYGDQVTEIIAAADSYIRRGSIH